jgi:superfamily II DNA or RNA helicase
VGEVVYEVDLAALVGTHLAPVSFVRMSVRLTREERARYARDFEPYVTLAGSVRRANPGADGETIGRILASTRAGREALAGRERAVALASFPEAKRTLVAALLERHQDDKTLVFTAMARDAYEVSRALLVPAITADIGRAEREDVLERFQSGAIRAIASARVLNEGIDVPDARVAIVLGGRLGKREHIQRVGRVLRPVPGKHALVYELVTAGTIEDHRARRRQLALCG